MRKLIILTVGIFLTLLTDARASVAPVWTASLPGAAKWQDVTSIGTLLVGTDSGLCSLDPDSGAVLWSRTDFPKNSPFNVHEIPGTPILLVNNHSGAFSPKTKITALNIGTGETIWQTGEKQGYPLGIYPILEKNMVLVFANSSTEADGVGLYMTAYKISSGEQLWMTKHSGSGDVPLHPADNSGKFFVTMDLSGHQQPMVQGDLVYVPFAGVHCFDLNTGVLKWGVDFRSVPKDFKRASAALVFDDENVYASAVNGVYAINKTTGEVKWKSKKVFSGTIVQLADTGDKILVRLGGNFLKWGSKEWTLEKPLRIVALDKKTGETAWQYDDIKDGITNLQIVKDQNLVVVADSRHMAGIDLNSTGDATTKFVVPLEFKRSLGAGEAVSKIGLGMLGGLQGLTKAAVKAGSGKDRMDIPVAIAQVGNIDVVRGRQHVLAFDPAKQEITWSCYYPAPGSSGFEMAIMTALTAASALTYNAGYASGAYSYNSAANGIQTSLANYDKFSNKRYSATQAAKQNVYILTKVEEGGDKGVGLMAINLSTGDPAGQVLLKDKEPDYAVDDVTGMLYYVSGKKEISAYDVTK